MNLCNACGENLIEGVQHICLEAPENQGFVPAMTAAKRAFEIGARRWQTKYGGNFWDSFIPPGTSLIAKDCPNGEPNGCDCLVCLKKDNRQDPQQP